MPIRLEKLLSMAPLRITKVPMSSSVPFLVFSFLSLAVNVFMRITRLVTFLWLLSYDCKEVKPICCLNSSLKIGLFVKCGTFCAFFQAVFFISIGSPVPDMKFISSAFPHHTFPAAPPDFAMFEELRGCI